MKDEGRNLKDVSNGQPVKSIDLQRFFHDSDLVSFFTKKSERIAAALHLVSNFFDAQEPVKWRIRTLSIDLVSNATALSFSAKADQRVLLLDLNKSLSDIQSILGILHIASMISGMNYRVISSELGELLNLIPDRASLNNPQYIDDNFFLTGTATESVYSELLHGEKKTERSLSQNSNYFIKDIFGYKGHNIKKTQNNGIMSVKASPISLAPEKNNRREIILNTVRKIGQVTIKDISLTITDCSEKTLQRELLALVESGVLKKEGERRWSKYSLRA